MTATGVPHFDGYADPDALPSRTTLCADLGLDPQRPIVLYAACTPYLAPDEPLVVSRLADDLARHPARPQLFVRLHPADPGNRFTDIATRDDLVIEVPGAARDDRPAGITAFCPDPDEARRALATVTHADAVVNIASTISLEAALADRPTINVAFDLAPGAPHAERIASYYRYDHYRTVLDCDAARLVETPAALVDAISEAIAHPDAQRAGRARLAATWCQAPDASSPIGGAGARLGAALTALMNDLTVPARRR